jgi:hypothetical protein
MRTLKSINFDNSLLPIDSIIYDQLEFIGFKGYIPKTFLADLLIISKSLLLGYTIKDTKYSEAIISILDSAKIINWLEDTIILFNIISKKYNLRILESYITNNKKIDLSSVPFSYNYNFDLKSINPFIIKLLKITEKQIEEIEILSDEVIDVLTIASRIGNFRKTAKTHVLKLNPIRSYGDITKIQKYKLIDPLFSYKFSIKAYDVVEEVEITNKSSKMVVGYFFNSSMDHKKISLLLKLLGVLILSEISNDFSLVIYSFYMDTYSKKELITSEEIIDYFSKPKQLKLFPINNTKALNTILYENKNSDIIFIPDISNACYVTNNYTTSTSVNIISLKTSKFNLQYSNVCKKTGGKFITI